MWNNDFKTDFLSSLKNAETTEKLNRLNASIPNCTENYEIDQCLSELTSIIEQAASPIFKNHQINPKARNICFQIKPAKTHGMMKVVLKRNIISCVC